MREYCAPMMLRFVSLCLLLLTVGIHLPLRALVIDGYSANTNDRFAHHPDFIARDFNLSGVAISSDGRWGTLIAPNIFLSAQHFPPAVGQTLTFYATHDPAGPSVTRTVAALRQRIGTSDLLLCTLNEPVPEGYAVYAFATESLSTTSGWLRYPYRDSPLLHFGRSPGAYPTSRDVSVGQNRLNDLRLTNQIISDPAANGPAVECDQDPSGSLNHLTYETFAQFGDSGAPLFYDQGNTTLKLVGIAWYITGGSPPATGFSAVGNHADSIESFITANASPYQPLPPEDLNANRISDSRIDLNWTDPSAVENTFILERAETADGPWFELVTLPANSTSYQDLSAPAGDVYYRLRAENDSPSAWVSVGVLTPYSLWAAQFDWGGADQRPAADANNDGLANLVAYSMDLSPLVPVPVEAQPRLEFPVGFIDYIYRRDPDAGDLSFRLMHKTNLLSPGWTEIPIDGSDVTETDIGPADSARWFRIRMPTAVVAETGFFRLEITSRQLP